MNVFRTLTVCGISTFLFLISPGLDSFAQEAFPETPAGKRMAQLLKSVDQGGESLATFLVEGFATQDDTSVSRRESEVTQVRSQLGDLRFKKATESTDTELTALCTTSAGPDVLLTIVVGEQSPHLIDQIQLRMSEEVAEDQSPLTSDERSTTIQLLMEQLKSSYVFPKVAEEMCSDLEKSLEDGAYDQVDDIDEFAAALTKQLRAICHDKHLRVRAMGEQTSRSRASRDEAENHGFEKVEFLPGGIGYLKFNHFSGDPKAEAPAAAAMNFLASSRALIVDLRENGGGSPDMIAFLSGYLFEKSVHLNSFYDRPTDTTSESWSRDDVPGQKLAESCPIYVLTSNRTFSGAEEFSYNLQNLKRGVIVGETTGGGAHPTMGRRLGKRFGMSVPFARAINPITNTNWEGVGVKPDVAVAADKALEKAIAMANDHLHEAVSATEEPAESASEPSVASLLADAGEHRDAQEFAEAAAVYQKVVKVDSENEMAWFHLGYCLHMDGQLDEAIQAHQRAAKYANVAILATYNLACAYSLKDEGDQAFEALTKAMDIGFDDARQLRDDSDWDNLREDDRFVKALKRLDGGS